MSESDTPNVPYTYQERLQLFSELDTCRVQLSVMHTELTELRQRVSKLEERD